MLLVFFSLFCSMTALEKPAVSSASSLSAVVHILTALLAATLLTCLSVHLPVCQVALLKRLNQSGSLLWIKGSRRQSVVMGGQWVGLSRSEAGSVCVFGGVVGGSGRFDLFYFLRIFFFWYRASQKWAEKRVGTHCSTDASGSMLSGSPELKFKFSWQYFQKCGISHRCGCSSMFKGAMNKWVCTKRSVMKYLSQIAQF